MTDLYSLGFIGFAGYALRALDYSLAPLVLGLSLTLSAEINPRQALMNNENPSLYFTRQISLLFLIAAVLSIA